MRRCSSVVVIARVAHLFRGGGHDDYRRHFAKVIAFPTAEAMSPPTIFDRTARNLSQGLYSLWKSRRDGSTARMGGRSSRIVVRALYRARLECNRLLQGLKSLATTARSPGETRSPESQTKGSDSARRYGCGSDGRRAILLGSLAFAFGLSATGCSNTVWRPDLGGAMRLAAERNQIVVVQYYSPFNGDCWRMEDEVFTVPEVEQSLRTVIPVRINALLDRSFEREFGLAIIPSFVAIAPDGAELRRASGYLDADRFRAFVDLSRLSN